MKRLLAAGRVVFVLFVVSFAPMGYSATLECAGTRYERGVCWYGMGELERAARDFAAVVEEGREDHETLKAIYFLARTRMRAEDWSDASRLWIRLFELSPSFYREWNGDFLLGECRRAAEGN